MAIRTGDSATAHRHGQPAITQNYAVAGTMAQTLSHHPRFCDLLASSPSVLEEPALAGLSVEFVPAISRALGLLLDGLTRPT